EHKPRINLQRRIQAAVTGQGSWEGVPDAMRRQADTPWVRSVLQFDTAQVVPKTRQPILIVHGELDPNIPVSEADRLATIANARKKSTPAAVVRQPAPTQKTHTQ